MIASAKQSFRAPVTVRLGDREIIKVKPFVRIASTLSMQTGVFAADVPRFDPMKFVSDEPQERAPDPGTADAPGAEVSVIKRDLGDVALDPNAPALSDEDVTAQVEESAASPRKPAGAPPCLWRRRSCSRAPCGRLGLPRLRRQEERGGRQPVQVDRGPGRPRDVTKLAKVELRSGEAPLVEERDLALKRGDTVEAMLKATGHASDAAIAASSRRWAARPRCRVCRRGSSSASRSRRGRSRETGGR